MWVPLRRTCRDDALREPECFNLLPRVRPLVLVVCRDVVAAHRDVVFAICEAVQLLKHEVEDVKPEIV